MKNKSVHSCRFVHHAKLHCLMTTLSNLFKIEFERGNWKRALVSSGCNFAERCKKKIVFTKKIVFPGAFEQKQSVVLKNIWIIND